MALKGLVIDRPWIGMILAGDKIWEMRSRGTAVRGRIALIEKGTGTVVGLATLADSLPALAPEQMQAHFAKHRIPPAKVAEPGFRWFTPWVLTDVRRLDRPVPYRHPSGAVTWVNLSADEEMAILGSRRAGATSTTQPVPSAGRVMPEHRALAGRVVSQISDEAGLGIPAGASTRVRRDGSRLYIDVEWDDGLPAPRSVSGWRDVMGLFGVAGSALCALGAMIHLPLAILFSGITIFGALKWVGAMFIAMLVAVIGGHGDELEGIFGKR